MVNSQKEKLSILNIGSGKSEPLDLDLHGQYFIVNVDPCYIDKTEIDEIDRLHKKWNYIKSSTKIFYIKSTWQDFISSYRNSFDRVVLYRYLEHVRMTEVLYFIYMLSTCIKIGGLVDVIVPNYTLLSDMLLQEDINDKDYEFNNILLTTELLNEPEDPHASIWTPQRARYYFELEKRFKVIQINERFIYDNRNIYMRIIAERVSIF